MYDPLENAEEMVINALNIGLQCMTSDPDENRIAAEIYVFAEKYGLLGFMTALPTTPEFMNYETVYLSKNRFIREESMLSEEYAKTFFPFDDEINKNPKKQFKDWALIFCASFLYYEETDPLMADLHRKSISVFDGNMPSFHIELFDKPTLVWDFHSLMLTIHIMLGLLLTDEKKPLRSCKYCNRVFIAKHSKTEFWGHECKNKYNVYKSRDKKDTD